MRHLGECRRPYPLVHELSGLLSRLNDPRAVFLLSQGAFSRPLKRKISMLAKRANQASLDHPSSWPIAVISRLEFGFLRGYG
jgi:hypothetical protein